MTDVEYILWLGQVSRMDRNELWMEMERIDAADPDKDESHRSLSEVERYVRAAANVFSVDNLLKAPQHDEDGGYDDERERTGGRTRAGARHRGVRRTGMHTIDLDKYERDKGLLKDRSDRHKECERMREAVRRRLKHFDRMDGLVYRPIGKMPLERYLESLTRK